MSKSRLFTIPYFYIIWKIVKNPTIGRPIMAGFDGILPHLQFSVTFCQQIWQQIWFHPDTQLKLCKIVRKSKVSRKMYVFYNRLKKCAHKHSSGRCYSIRSKNKSQNLNMLFQMLNLESNFYMLFSKIVWWCSPEIISNKFLEL